MTISQYAGIAIVPTFSRIVLCAAFITTGYNKFFQQATFTESEAQRLKVLGVLAAPIETPGAKTSPEVPAEHSPDSQPPSKPPAEPSGASTPGAGEAPPASDVAPASNSPGGSPTANSSEPPAQAATESTAAPTQGTSIPQSGTSQAEAVHREAATVRYVSARIHKVTLMLDDARWPAPLWLARWAAVTELAGGALLAIGLFSRVWGLGLAVSMACAFALTSVHAVEQQGLFGLSVEQFNMVFCQAGLFVLALGVMLTGPGPLSLDRLLFSRSDETKIPQDE